jgi:hypothetical protein
MKTIHYDKHTSLTHFMDEFAIQRMEGIIEFEQQCTPTNKELVKTCQTVIKHLKGIWDIR